MERGRGAGGWAEAAAEAGRETSGENTWRCSASDGAGGDDILAQEIYYR